MIRAIVGTVAVLAGFAVLERSVDASTGYAGSCTPTNAYALLQRGETVPVRAEPTPQAVTIGSLQGRATAKPDLARAMVTMTGSQGGWARIALNTQSDYVADGAAATQPYGWVPADLLTVNARVHGDIAVYNQPGLLGRQLATIEGDDMKFRVLGCRGAWLHVINARHGSVWIDRWCGREDGCRS